MTEKPPTYTDQEVALIVRKATELSVSSRSSHGDLPLHASDVGLSLEDIRRVLPKPGCRRS